MTRAVITGGAGFIGSNLARRLLSEGHEVVVVDNLSTSGGPRNLEWLRSADGTGELSFIQADLRDFEGLCRAFEGAQRVYHLASQVAVTISVQDPRRDFEENAVGTFNALEAARVVGDDPVFIYSSTNKVYGGLESVGVIEEATRYRYADLAYGIAEDQPLDFHSPYGCSKGAGDQYTRDYHRIYGLRSVVFRQSCIYGPRQFGREDQGWLAWFLIAMLLGRSITVFGDGKQVRDVLYIDDLLDAYEAAVQRIDVAAGQIYNLGGGPTNSISIWVELRPLLEELAGTAIQVSQGEWRPGDQRIFVADVRKAQRELGWTPRVGVRDGLTRLYSWIRDNRHLFN